MTHFVFIAQVADFVVEPVEQLQWLPAAGRPATAAAAPRKVSFTSPNGLPRYAWDTTQKLGREHGWWDRLGEPCMRSQETQLGGGVSQLGSEETGLRWLYYRPEELARHAELWAATPPEQDAGAEAKAAMQRTRAAFLRRAAWMAEREGEGGLSSVEGGQGGSPGPGPIVDGSDISGIRLNALRRIRCLLANLRAAEGEAEGMSQQQLTDILQRAQQRAEADAISLAAQQRQAAVQRALSKPRSRTTDAPGAEARAPPPTAPPSTQSAAQSHIPPPFGGTCVSPVRPLPQRSLLGGGALAGGDHLHRAHAEVQSQAAMLRHGQLRGAGVWGEYRGLTHLATEDPLFAAGTLEHFKRELRVRAVGGERRRETQVKRSTQRALTGRHNLAREGSSVEGDVETESRANAAANVVVQAVGGLGGYPHHGLANTDMRAAPRCRVL